MRPIATDVACLSVCLCVCLYVGHTSIGVWEAFTFLNLQTVVIAKTLSIGGEGEGT